MTILLILVLAGLACFYARRYRAAREDIRLLQQGRIDWAGYHAEKRRYLSREHLG